MHPLLSQTLFSQPPLLPQTDVGVSYPQTGTEQFTESAALSSNALLTPRERAANLEQTFGGIYAAETALIVEESSTKASLIIDETTKASHAKDGATKVSHVTDDTVVSEGGDRFSTEGSPKTVDDPKEARPLQARAENTDRPKTGEEKTHLEMLRQIPAQDSVASGQSDQNMIRSDQPKARAAANIDPAQSQPLQPNASAAHDGIEAEITDKTPLPKQSAKLDPAQHYLTTSQIVSTKATAPSTEHTQGTLGQTVTSDRKTAHEGQVIRASKELMTSVETAKTLNSNDAPRRIAAPSPDSLGFETKTHPEHSARQRQTSPAVASSGLITPSARPDPGQPSHKAHDVSPHPHETKHPLPQAQPPETKHPARQAPSAERMPLQMTPDRTQTVQEPNFQAPNLPPKTATAAFPVMPAGKPVDPDQLPQPTPSGLNVARPAEAAPVQGSSAPATTVQQTAFLPSSGGLQDVTGRERKQSKDVDLPVLPRGTGSVPRTIQPQTLGLTATPTVQTKPEQILGGRADAGPLGDIDPAPTLRSDGPATGQTTAAQAPVTRMDLPHHVARQIADVLQHMPSRPVEITLNPEELGRVRLGLATAEAGITVHVLAERPETMDLLRRHISALETAFEALGYSDISFSFSGNRTTSDDGPDGRSPANQNPLSDEQDPTIHGPVTAIQITPSANTGIDIRL